MSDTPERIVICNHSEHGPMWFAKQPDMPVVFFGDSVTDEYIRIDLYEQLQAEVESLKADLEAANYDWNKDPDRLVLPPKEPQ